MSRQLLLLHLLPFFFFTAVPAVAQSNNQYGNNCPSYTCGDVNISYPFWKMGTETTNQFCGYQGFGINCSEIGGRNISRIDIGNDSYYVRSITSNNNYRSIVLADYDVSSVAPGPPNGCPRVRHNISLGTLPLQFPTSMVNISFHFNCTGHPSFAIEIPCLFRTERNARLCDRDYNDSERMFADFSNKSLVSCAMEAVVRRVRPGQLVADLSSSKETQVQTSLGSQEKSDIETGNCVASLKDKTEDDEKVEAFVMQYGALSMKRYEYNDIKKMTNSFQVKLGQGGFGQVFKGKLSDGRLVAVKLLNTSKANGQEFINEVASIGRTSHVNIVTLLGFCFDYKKRALVYEYMPNGSLEKFIHSYVQKGTSEQLGATKLYEIALGIAHGLDYLHRGCNTRILHLDIKPHNILLDEDFCPKIADFGLAKLYSRKESIVSMLEARGTIGYIAPEIYNQNFGGVSHKSDVYSYGMLLLEMVGGRKNIDAGVGFGQTSEIYFPDWIYKRLHNNGFVLDSITTTEEDVYARKMTIVGLWCIQFAPNQRPAMNEVIEMLEGSIKALEVPPKPFFSSPPRSPGIICSTSESMIELA
ncbi:hypothetical protein E3N88_04662 [Mikania micrantha]|uniref:Protein kinase domain-containing protein n=1 Tax=Mikania micrantha TaxID=192012 RepID=A0A5N6PV27_9ASTR|nr:hypothetical protein E3N88_04662 [Mikania micrantha]